MAPKPVKKAQKPQSTGNPETDRLLDEISKHEVTIDNLVKARESLVTKNSALNVELRLTKESLDKALEEIKSLKGTLDLSEDKDRQKSEGFLEIVYVPPVPGIKPTPKYCNGILYNSKIDADGFHHWFYPIAQAKAVLGTCGSNHVLAGPMDEIEVEQVRGAYAYKIVCKRHVCRNGQWIPVEIEESKEA